MAAYTILLAFLVPMTIITTIIVAPATAAFVFAFIGIPLFLWLRHEFRKGQREADEENPQP